MACGKAGKPLANFDYEVQSCDFPITVQFTNLSDNYDEALWKFGDGKTSNEVHPAHVFETKGVYRIELVATNSDDYANEHLDFVHLPFDTYEPTASFKITPLNNSDVGNDTYLIPCRLHVENESNYYTDVQWLLPNNTTNNTYDATVNFYETGYKSIGLVATCGTKVDTAYYNFTLKKPELYLDNVRLLKMPLSGGNQPIGAEVWFMLWKAGFEVAYGEVIWVDDMRNATVEWDYFSSGFGFSSHDEVAIEDLNDQYEIVFVFREVNGLSESSAAYTFRGNDWVATSASNDFVTGFGYNLFNLSFELDLVWR